MHLMTTTAELGRRACACLKSKQTMHHLQPKVLQLTHKSVLLQACSAASSLP